MKTKIIFGLLALLLITFTILLFIPENKALKIITSPKVYSSLKSSDNEYFYVQLLLSNQGTYYFDSDYISSVSLSSELDEEIIPLIISEITNYDEQYIYDYEEYTVVELKLEIGFDSNDYLVDFEKAYLNINYNNNTEIKLFIGEFNYIFNSEINNEIAINNLSSTVYEIDGINTVSGVFIELHNLSDENLVINSFNLGSSSLSFNNYYLSELYNEPDLFDKVEDILLLEEYNFHIFSNEVEKSILLRENQSVMLYIPISYIGDINYIHRFYFEITYKNNEGINTMIIDDIPYISTSIFQECFEDGYIVYEIQD